MHANGRHPRIVQQRQCDLRLTGLCHVSARHHERDRQAALLHREVDGDVRALRQDRHAALDRDAAVLVRPQQRAIQCIDEPVAIGAEDRHIARRSNQRGLHVSARRIFGLCFGEPGGKAHRTARAHRCKGGNNVHAGRPIDAGKDRIRRFGQVIDTWKRPVPGDLDRARVHRPDRSVKSHFLRLTDHRRAPDPSADHGNGFRTQKSGQRTGHPAFLLPRISRAARGAGPALLSDETGSFETIQAPRGRRRSRLMMCRWISDVPSQMRSTRASRQNRSIGKSSISPMPPKICKVVSVTRASISEA